uniref:Uncharacterized protein n=1 Tax=Glossina pallidipes TaxID=7398 RepID=A0A1A9Z0B9_GLOPL
MVLNRSYAGFAVVSADAVDILKRICHFECCSSMYGYGVRILCKVDDCYLLNATTSYNAIIINRCRHLSSHNWLNNVLEKESASQHNLKAGLFASFRYISFPNASVFKLFISSHLLYAGDLRKFINKFYISTSSFLDFTDKWILTLGLLSALQPEARIDWLQCQEFAMFVPFEGFLDGTTRLWGLLIMIITSVLAFITGRSYHHKIVFDIASRKMLLCDDASDDDDDDDQ